MLFPSQTETNFTERRAVAPGLDPRRFGAVAASCAVTAVNLFTWSAAAWLRFSSTRDPVELGGIFGTPWETILGSLWTWYAQWRTYVMLREFVHEQHNRED